MTSTTAATVDRTNDRLAAAAKAMTQTEANRGKLAMLERVLKEQLSAVLTTGFHGMTLIELAINDGTIQHVRHSVEQMER